MTKKKTCLLLSVSLLSAIILGSLYFTGYLTFKRETPASYDVELNHTFQSVSSVPIGVAVDTYNLQENQTYRNLVVEHFNSIVAEWQMKWNSLEAEQGFYDWEKMDYLVEFAENNSMEVHGHALLWHESNPDWFNNYSGTTEEWKQLVKNHIQTVVGRYAGRITSWDVVNEAFDGASWRKSIFYEKIGEQYFKLAYQWAHEADPDAILYYNDYGFSSQPAKVDFAIQKLKLLKGESVPIHGIGIQSHIGLKSPEISELQQIMDKWEEFGLPVRVSELDIALNSNGRHSVFTDDLADAQGERYEQVAAEYLKYSNLTGITLWGLYDGHSWIPDHHGHVDWPLLFNETFGPKPAARGFLNALQNDSVI